MRTWHIRSHFEDEVVGRWRSSWLCGLGSTCEGGRCCCTCGTVRYTEDNVEELYEGRLCIRSATILTVWFRTTSVLVDHTVWKTSVCHVFGTSQERSDAMVENVRIAVLVHSVQKTAKLIHTFCHYLKGVCHGAGIPQACSSYGICKKRYEGCTSSFNGDRDEVEP